MKAKYVIRFDDACPTMDLYKWTNVENICDKYGIKPIVAVIPNNKDQMLMCLDEDIDFWKKVQKWQEKGWHIALHGYDHIYVNQESGLVPFNNDSEFAGLSYEEQKSKIDAGLKIFASHNINTNIWVAPSHSFDTTTLKVLKETPITIISDGIGLFPFKKYGLNWIPQQIWRFRKIPFGTWTVCFHPNVMTDKEIDNMELFIKENHDDFIDIKTLKFKKFSILNKMFEIVFWKLWKIKKRG
jgi:predicted deacetylase